MDCSVGDGARCPVGVTLLTKLSTGEGREMLQRVSEAVRSVKPGTLCNECEYKINLQCALRLRAFNHEPEIGALVQVHFKKAWLCDRCHCPNRRNWELLVDLLWSQGLQVGGGRELEITCRKEENDAHSPVSPPFRTLFLFLRGLMSFMQLNVTGACMKWSKCYEISSAHTTAHLKELIRRTKGNHMKSNIVEPKYMMDCMEMVSRRWAVDDKIASRNLLHLVRFIKGLSKET